MNDYISIDTSKLPLQVQIKDDNKFFYMQFTYNATNGKIYVSLLDQDKNVLAYKEKIVYGAPLWFDLIEDLQGNYREDFPSFDIVPLSLTGEDISVTKDTLNVSVFLVIVERG